MRMVSLIWGIVAFLIFCLGLIPCLGWLNWFNIPMALIGIVISAIALGRTRGGEQSTAPAVIGLVLSLIAVCVGGVRLLLGGGVL